MTELLVTGAGGMLGGAFVARLGEKAVRLDRRGLDTSDIPAILAAVDATGARVVINCAAHTDVDGAETAPEDAWRVNALLPGILGQACRRMGSVLVHFSSTGTYGDWKDGPYDEEDPLRPTTVHHRSKAAGEVAVRESGCEYLVVRTGWLFGGGPAQAKNFVWKRIIEAVASPVMTSDSSQRGNPTAAGDVVDQVLATLTAGYRGTINVVSQGSATRFEYVKRIVAAAGLDCHVSPTTTPFVRKAHVSLNEAAVNRRLRLLGLDCMPNWTDAVDGYVKDLKATPEWHALVKTP